MTHPLLSLIYDTALSTHLSLAWVGSLFISEMIALWSHSKSAFPGYNYKGHTVSMLEDGLVYLPILLAVRIARPKLITLHALAGFHSPYLTPHCHLI